MKRKGFTLVELLVVIAIIALLMGILMPALARVRQIAYRMVCGTNLAGIGKAMLIYSNDNKERYPRSGQRVAYWTQTGHISDWKNATWFMAFLDPEQTSVGSCWYQLIKYADVQPKQFVCRGDAGTKTFKVTDGLPTIGTAPLELKDVWDFGEYDDVLTESQPGKFYSYSYQHPFFVTDQQRADGSEISYVVSPIRPPDTPVGADRNPYLDKNSCDYIDCINTDEELADFEVLPDGSQYYTDVDKTANAAAHQREGQNVLFNDAHVGFAKYPNIGIDNDNIYKTWQMPDPQPVDIQLGASPYIGSCEELSHTNNRGNPQLEPFHERDAILVNETNRRNE